MGTNEDHAASLVDKLNSLNLTDEEREVLGHLLIHEGSPDVEGFGQRDYLANLSPVQGFNIGMPPKNEFNIGMPPTKN